MAHLVWCVMVETYTVPLEIVFDCSSKIISFTFVCHWRRKNFDRRKIHHNLHSDLLIGFQYFRRAPKKKKSSAAVLALCFINYIVHVAGSTRIMACQIPWKHHRTEALLKRAVYTILQNFFLLFKVCTKVQRPPALSLTFEYFHVLVLSWAEL